MLESCWVDWVEWDLRETGVVNWINMDSCGGLWRKVDTAHDRKVDNEVYRETGE